MRAKQGWIDITTGAINTTFTVTLGWQPKIVFLWWNGRTDTSDAVGGATHRRGFGAFTSTSNRMCLDTREVDAQGSSVCSSYMHNTAAIIAHTDTTLDGLIDVDLVDSTSFRLIVDDVMPYALRVGYLALGGSDVVNAIVGSMAAAANGDFDLSGLGWNPNFGMFFSNGTTSALPAGQSTNGIFNIGVFTGTGTGQGVLCSGNDDASNTMDAASYCTDQDAHSFIDSAVGTAIIASTDFTAWASGGWDLTGSVPSTIVSIYVALQLTNVIVTNVLTRTDGNDIAISGLGWKPAAGLVLSHCKAESSGTTLSRHDETSIGAFTATDERGALGVRSEDAVADSNVATAIEHDAVYVNISTTDDTVEGLMDVKSVDSGGVTFVMDDTDPAQAFVVVALFGPWESGGPTINLSAATLTAAGQPLDQQSGAVSKALAAAALTAAGQVLDVQPGVRTLAMAAASLIASGQILDVQPGAVSKALAAAALSVLGQSVGVSAGGGSPQTVNLLAAALVAVGQLLDIQPGAVSKALAVAALSASGQTLDQQSGAVSKALAAAALSAQGPSISVSLGGSPQVINLLAAALAPSGQALDVQPGAVSKALAAAALLTAGQTINISLGASPVTVNLASALLSDTGQTLDVQPGAFVLALDAASLLANGPLLDVIAIPAIQAGRATVMDVLVGTSVILDALRGTAAMAEALVGDAVAMDSDNGQ